MSPTLYYHPSAEGQLDVSLTVADSQAGLASVTFPEIFGPLKIKQFILSVY